MTENRAIRIKNILERICYATIATVSGEGEVLNTPVYFAFDTSYNLYWGSPREATHSKNVRANGSAFIVTYDSTVKPGTGEGVYIKALCRELLIWSEIETAFNLIQKRRHPIDYWRLDDFKDSNPIGLYKATPLEFSTNDEFEVNGTIIDKRTVVAL